MPPGATWNPPFLIFSRLQKIKPTMALIDASRMPSVSVCATKRTQRIQKWKWTLTGEFLFLSLFLAGRVRASSHPWEAPLATSSRRQNDSQYNERQADNLSGFQRWPDEPPPPPPPSSSNYNPIDYSFASREHQQASSSRSKQDENTPDDIPQTYSEPMPELEADDMLPKYASPRKDVIARYMSQSKTQRALLITSSGMVGGMLGAFVGKSILNRPQSFAVLCFIIFVVCTYLRNPYGELVKASGMALILALQRSRNIWRRYPTWKHVKASIGADQRQPFPPADNPWAYQAVEPDDVDFSMLYTLVAMGFIGSMCGGNLPLIPTWMGALAGAGLLAFGTTTRDARGDLARSMGMRVVSLGQEAIGINRELELLSKLGVVSGKILDKILILDRKHRIKDRLIAGFSWVYEQVSRTAAEVQNDMQAPSEEPPERRRREGDRRPPPRDDREDDDRRRQREGDRNAPPFPYKQGDPRPR